VTDADIINIATEQGDKKESEVKWRKRNQWPC
jgi:hypothetical protein